MSIILLVLALILLFGWRPVLTVAIDAWGILSKPARSWAYLRALAGILLALASVVLSVPGPPSHPVSGGGAYVLQGTVGEVTDAVKALQKAKGLPVDGVLGPKTCPHVYKRCPVI